MKIRWGYEAKNQPRCVKSKLKKNAQEIFQNFAFFQNGVHFSAKFGQNSHFGPKHGRHFEKEQHFLNNPLSNFF